MLQEVRDQLGQTETRIRELREERARAKRVADQAKAAFAESNDPEGSPTFLAAKGAMDSVREINEKIEAVGEEQTRLLRQLGDAEAGRSGFAWAGVNGWVQAADRIDLNRGELRFDTGAQALLQPAAAPPLPTTPSAPAVPAPVSNRFLFPVFEAVPFSAGDPGALAATDFTISFSQSPASGLADPVEIATATATEKATLGATAALATPTARTFAVIADQVPAKLWDSRDALRAFFSVEMSRRLSESYDDHVITAIEGAAPPSGSTGSDLVSKIRFAIADAHDLGGEPTVIALTPSDAASLDLEQDAGGFVFRVDAPRVEGAGSQVWSLRVREAPSVTHPLLVSPSQLGLSYTGGGSVMVDPYGANLQTNQVSVRVEAEAKFHVRNAVQGAFAIS